MPPVRRQLHFINSNNSSNTNENVPVRPRLTITETQGYIDQFITSVFFEYINKWIKVHDVLHGTLTQNQATRKASFLSNKTSKNLMDMAKKKSYNRDYLIELLNAQRIQLDSRIPRLNAIIRSFNQRNTMGIDPRFYNNNRTVNYTRNSNEVKRLFSNNPSNSKGSYPHFYRNGKLKNNINLVDPITNNALNINSAWIIKNSRGKPHFFNKNTLQKRIIQQLHNGEKPSNFFNRKEIKPNNITQVPTFIKEDIRRRRTS